jgi:hypothetical protein
MDCAFMAMFKTRIAIENRANIKTNKNVVFTKLVPINAKAKHTNETNNGPLLSNLETSQPEATVPISAANGIIIKTLPNCASFKLKKVLIVGILEAQDAKHNPDRKKYVLKEMRCICLDFILLVDDKSNL